MFTSHTHTGGGVDTKEIGEVNDLYLQLSQIQPANMVDRHDFAVQIQTTHGWNNLTWGLRNITCIG